MDVADARFAVEHQHAPAPAAHAGQQAVERLAFTPATEKLPAGAE
jgi:hypothetical protein